MGVNSMIKRVKAEIANMQKFQNTLDVGGKNINYIITRRLYASGITNIVDAYKAGAKAMSATARQKSALHAERGYKILDDFLEQ